MKPFLRLGQRALDFVTEYTGHMYDPLLEVYYARARMYDPATSRMLSPDPVKGTVLMPKTLTAYVYCIDNPLKYIDVHGLETAFINGNPIMTIDRDGKTYGSLIDMISAIDGGWHTTVSHSSSRGVYLTFEAGVVSTNLDSYVWFLTEQGSLIARSKNRETETIPYLFVEGREDSKWIGITGRPVDLYIDIDYFCQLMCDNGFKAEKQTKPLINLQMDTTLGLSATSKNTFMGLARTMLNEGFELAFVSGMLANIYHEGTEAGKFESSAYKTGKPTYLQHMDNNYDYKSKYSGQNVVGKSLSELEILLTKLKADNWQKGKFGLGSVQWTGERTKTLVDIYREVAGANDYVTFDQMLQVEGLMISRELGSGGAYSKVYLDWKGQNSGNIYSKQAAYNAGYILCISYEVPAGAVDKAPIRGKTAEKVFGVMAG
jgi:RHS repeat-associated protein